MIDQVIPTHDKPLAVAGLTSYRYRGAYGWIMIGAKDTADALREANRSLCSGTATIDGLQIYTVTGYKPVTE